MTVKMFKEMFERIIIPKNIEMLPVYYHPDFQLTTNGQLQDYTAFADGHRKIYPTPITYHISYDEEAWVEAGNRVAGRIWITAQRPDEEAITMEIIVIAQYLGGRLHRLWELTWPEWSTLKSFEKYG